MGYTHQATGKEKSIFAQNRGHKVDFCPHALLLQVWMMLVDLGIVYF